MTLNEYQDLAIKFAKYLPQDAISYTALAINEEAGEYAGKVGKWIRKGREEPFPSDAAAKELGDTLWQIQAAAKAIGYTLEEIASMNLEKLIDRETRGVIVGSGDDR